MRDHHHAQLVMPLPRVDNPAPLLRSAPTTRAFDKLLNVLAYLCHTIDTHTTEVRLLSLGPRCQHPHQVERRHLPVLACLGRVAAPPGHPPDDIPSLVLEHHVAHVRHMIPYALAVSPRTDASGAFGPALVPAAAACPQRQPAVPARGTQREPGTTRREPVRSIHTTHRPAKTPSSRPRTRPAASTPWALHWPPFCGRAWSPTTTTRCTQPCGAFNGTALCYTIGMSPRPQDAGRRPHPAAVKSSRLSRRASTLAGRRSGGGCPRRRHAGCSHGGGAAAVGGDGRRAAARGGGRGVEGVFGRRGAWSAAVRRST